MVVREFQRSFVMPFPLYSVSVFASDLSDLVELGTLAKGKIRFSDCRYEIGEL
jgi:hypothetical protein